MGTCLRAWLCVVAVVVAGSVLIQSAVAATLGSADLVIGEDFADPGVLKADDGTFYAYSTSGHSGPDPSHPWKIPFATALSPTGPWAFGGNAMPELPAWAQDGGYWAPDVSKRADGKYLMYFTAPSSGRMCLGAAVAATPAGPFEPIGGGPMVCNLGEGGDIDSSSFTDIDGVRYLLYKSDGNAIGLPSVLWLQRVKNDGVTLVGDRVELLRSDRPKEDHGVVEAPVLIKRASQYVLFYAEGVYSEDYKTGYAVSSALSGPYTKAAEPLMTTGKMGVDGPGGADVIATKQDQIFFHGWLNGARDARGMYVAELDWVDDNPVVEGNRAHLNKWE